MTKAITPKFAAYDSDGIWATGHTPEEALANFQEELRLDDDDMRELNVETTPMTDRLAQMVEERGYDANSPEYEYEYVNGTLDLVDAGETVQMINAACYEWNGFVEYHGDPEDADDLRLHLSDRDDLKTTVVSRDVRGWCDYKAIIRLDHGPDITATYYLVPEGFADDMPDA